MAPSFWEKQTSQYILGYGLWGCPWISLTFTCSHICQCLSFSQSSYAFFRIFFLSRCMGVNEFHVLCHGPIFNLSNTSQFRMFPFLCGSPASYI